MNCEFIVQHPLKKEELVEDDAMQNENNVERFANFKFITPGVMEDNDLTLKLEEMGQTLTEEQIIELPIVSI